MRHLLAAPVAVALLLAGGCTPDGEPTAPAPSPTASAASPEPSPTPSPSPSPSPVESFPPAPATESAEQAAVRAAWMEYWRIYDKFTSDPTLSDLTETQSITTGDHQNVVLDIIRQLRDQEIRTVGGLKVRNINVTIDSDATGDLSQARLQYCVDRRDLMLENYGTGMTMPAPGEPTFEEEALLVQGLDGKWRVAKITNRPAPC